jgi:hypothetical protein
MIINERGRMGTEVVVAHLKALSEHLLGEIEENYQKKKKVRIAVSKLRNVVS